MPSYSDALTVTWQVAAHESGVSGHATIKPGHFFLALGKVCDLPLGELFKGADRGGFDKRLAVIEAHVKEVREVFHGCGLDPVRFRRRVRAELGSEGAHPSDGVMHRGPQSRLLFARAEELASIANCAVVRPIHLLWALCEIERAPWIKVLQEMNLDRLSLLRAAEAAGRNRGAGPAESADVSRGEQPQADVEAGTRTPWLDRYGRDLTRLAEEGKLRPVIGRRDEIVRLGQILLQQRRNNAVLVGEPGVGKTCIVEGLAQRMVGENVADQFRNKRIVEINMGLLIAGTKYRGDFEERLQRILAEASSDLDIILFIDEFHTVIGAGLAEGITADAADIMKPALARGDIRCIGATTTAEYRRYIERDEAFQRRFQVIWVEEPTRDETIEILRGLVPSFQEHHGLHISEEAVCAAVELSMRYAADNRLPDKAIDLIDEACARARLKTFSGLSQPSAISRRDIAEVVSERYRVPLENLTQDEATRLLGMEDALRLRVKGQDAAVKAVCEAVRTARVGLRLPNRPQGVFLFLGPTGTGKTELAKALAEFLFGSEERLIRLDMSEFPERHSVYRLIGSPPGYRDSEKEGELVSAVRTYPHSVVLLDEIEKAHPDIHHLFLQVFDDGRLTDSLGRRVSFTETIIILTSNLGWHGRDAGRSIGFDAMDSRDIDAEHQRRREHLLEAVREVMPPELLNRIQRIVFFPPLSREAVREIVDKILSQLHERLSSRRITLRLDDSAYQLLMAEGYSETYGAREMERTVATLIGEPLGRLLVEGGIAEGASVVVSAEEGRMHFTSQ
jgi:ATP-dependent Clp protease ATP-binding subunit ClpC